MVHILSDQDDCNVVMENLMSRYNNPSAMDIKMGNRSFLLKSEDKDSVSEKTYYESVLKLGSFLLTAEEQELKSLSKSRFMQIRDSLCSTSNLCFRISGYRCIGCSFLFIHDSSSTDHHSNIWLIDFGKVRRISPENRVGKQHSRLWEGQGQDDGFLLGVDNLIRMLEQLLCQSVDVKDLVQGRASFPEFQIYFQLAPDFKTEYVKPTIHHGNLFYPVNIAEYQVTEREFNLTVQTTFNTSVNFNNGYRGYAYKEHRYATVQFGEMTIVSSLYIRPYNQARRPTLVWIQRSLDGISFTDVELVFIKYSSDPEIIHGYAKLSVSSAMRAMGLRLSEYEPNASFSFRIYGFKPARVDADAYDPCDERLKNRNWEQRDILIVSESLIFYCDQSKSSLGKPYLVPHCFRL
ncbi:hypothetical protein Ciccas_011656, partial [Cichlidogyrus casuarinus]